ncbi:hypothetical protein WG66_005905 [Moniliophthora roreri]|nr:hypothetical protein WG66_005905 [Moniliophthora roreri]
MGKKWNTAVASTTEKKMRDSHPIDHIGPIVIQRCLPEEECDSTYAIEAQVLYPRKAPDSRPAFDESEFHTVKLPLRIAIFQIVSSLILPSSFSFFNSARNAERTL